MNSEKFQEIVLQQLAELNKQQQEMQKSLAELNMNMEINSLLYLTNANSILNNYNGSKKKSALMRNLSLNGLRSDRRGFRYD
ncbi:MAG: hypothetical protein AAGU27_24600 [Dehalobacterium sp.]